MDKPVLKTNTDTGLLKVLAFLSMLIDHVGYLFFSEYQILRIIGRLAFPLFAYCLVLGFIHTRNAKKYFLRLFAFAAISQIPYYICLFPYDTLENFHLNIGFTMILGLFSCFGIREKKYYCTAISLLLSFIPAIEYGFYGVCLITVMYLFIFENKAVFAFAVGICFASSLSLYFTEGLFDTQFWAIFSLLPILIKTESKIKIPRLINYGFYPVHLFLLWIAKKIYYEGMGFSVNGGIFAFLMWCVCALLFIVIGIASFFRKKPTGFWANAKQFEVTDVKAYNNVMGILFIVFGIVFGLTGIPLLLENAAWILLSVFGMMGAIIAMMAIYMIVITPKFEKK